MPFSLLICHPTVQRGVYAGFFVYDVLIYKIRVSHQDEGCRKVNQQEKPLFKNSKGLSDLQLYA